MKKIWLLVSGILMLTGCGAKDYEASINVLNWSSYIPDSVIRDFEKEYNVKVNYATYSSNEELLAKVSGVGEGTYDLIFPSDYMVEIMKNKGLIQKMDKSKLSNYNMVDKQFLKLDYDYNNDYSIPFLASSVVLAVNTDIVKEKIISYNDLLNSDYKDNIVLVDDTRIVIGSALMALGYDMNSTNAYELDEAKEWLLNLKPNVKAFDSDSPKSFLITKEESEGVDAVDGTLPRQEGDRMAASYVNYYTGNGFVALPVFGDPMDENAVKVLSELYPDRKIETIYAREILLGGGNIHCITQQVPKGTDK